MVAERLYFSGAVFALAHFAFVPAVAWKLRNIMEDEGGKERNSTETLVRWLKVHRLRKWSVDFLALGSFVGATMAAI